MWKENQLAQVQLSNNIITNNMILVANCWYISDIPQERGYETNLFIWILWIHRWYIADNMFWVRLNMGFRPQYTYFLTNPSVWRYNPYQSQNSYDLRWIFILYKSSCAMMISSKHRMEHGFLVTFSILLYIYNDGPLAAVPISKYHSALPGGLQPAWLGSVWFITQLWLLGSWWFGL